MARYAYERLSAQDGSFLLFEKANPRSLAAALEMLCAEPDVLKRLSRKARPPLSMESYADEIEKIYRHLDAR